MVREKKDFFWEECKRETKLFSKGQMVEEFSKACADVMDFMGDKLNEESTAQLILALTIVSGKTIKRLFEENKDMVSYSEREDI